MNFLNKLECKYGKYAIKNLMNYIIILYVLGFLIRIANQDFYYDVLALDVSKVLEGQIWRLITFIIMPPSDSSFIFVIFALYLYYILGNSLENVWGAFRFNVYFIMGIVFHIIAAFIIYFVFGVVYPLSTLYLNMSLFFAFAAVYPNMEFLLFFLIPVKVKWLAMLDAFFFVGTIFFGFTFSLYPYSVKLKLLSILLQVGIVPAKECAVAALVSLLNFLIFFFMTRNYHKLSPIERKRKKSYHKQIQRPTGAQHKCDICGRTSEDYPDLTFRYCSKCSGNHEYCQDHLFTHEHIK